MITFKCQCGKTLKAKAEAAGKRVRCPVCGEVAQVPAAPAEAPAAPAPAEPSGGGLELKLQGEPEPEAPKEPELGLQDYQPELGEHKVEGEGKHCPGCHMRLPAAALICTTCGYDFRTGKVFEEPKTLAERIPWKTIVKVVWQVALLALVVGLGWWAYKTATGKQKGGEEPAAPSSSPSSAPSSAPVIGRSGMPERPPSVTGHQPAERSRYVRNPPILHVVTRTAYLAPAPPNGLKIEYADGTHTAADAMKALRTKLAREARDKMRIAGHTVLKPREKTPLGGAELLKLRLELSLGWAYAESGGKLVPTHPYVASCEAAIVRDNDAVVWKAPASYEAKRPGTAPGKDAAAAIAEIKSAKSPTSLDDYADKLADKVASTVLNVPPDVAALAKLLDEGSGKK